MKVQLTNGIRWNQQSHGVGDVIDVSDVDASWLLSRGKAIPFDEGTKTADRSVGLEKSDAAPVKKRAKKKVAKKAASKD